MTPIMPYSDRSIINIRWIHWLVMYYVLRHELSKTISIQVELTNKLKEWGSHLNAP